MARIMIKPIEMYNREACLRIIDPPYFYEQLDPTNRVNHLLSTLPIRLEKVNERVWQKYPATKLKQMDEAAEHMSYIIDRSGELDMQGDLIKLRDFLWDAPVIFKNYEEIVAFVSLLYYEVNALMDEMEKGDGSQLVIEQKDKEIEELREQLSVASLKANSLHYEAQRMRDAIAVASQAPESMNVPHPAMLAPSQARYLNAYLEKSVQANEKQSGSVSSESSLLKGGTSISGRVDNGLDDKRSFEDFPPAVKAITGSQSVYDAGKKKLLVYLMRKRQPVSMDLISRAMGSTSYRLENDRLMGVEAAEFMVNDLVREGSVTATEVMVEGKPSVLYKAVGA